MEKGHLTYQMPFFCWMLFITPNVNAARFSERQDLIHPQDLPGIHISEARFAWSDVQSPA
jgi:hypothetical protein